MYKAIIHITLRPSILDPQGKATRQALQSLGYTEVDDVRIGKYIELMIEAESDEAARRIAEASCEKLLANPVMENYAIHFEAVQPA